MYKHNIIFFFCFLLAANTFSKENIGTSANKNNNYNKLAAACIPSVNTIDLDINNVRTTLLAGGDFWWNLGTARYEIPKIVPVGSAPSVNSLFAGSVWIGGIDAAGQLKVAAQTYRQSGDDFWPGPLDDNASVDKTVCDDFARHWKVDGETIDKFRQDFDNGFINSTNDVPKSILEWPGKENNANVPYLPTGREFAPFFDNDGDAIYDPLQGDYPVLDTSRADGYPDQMIWWVYNDKGDIHSETNGQAIGLEVQATAFGFKTNDEVNNMTFYKFRLINKATSDLDSTYMGMWVDADLGGAFDDYVGCDTTESLGICYNGDAFDQDFGSSRGYGNDPPIVGVDYFLGPINENGDTLGMSSFLFYNNDFSVIGNPTQATHYYGYLTGSWKDATPFTYGGNGHLSSSQPFNFMFPSDPADNSPGAWSECTEGITPADRRFLQSSGPFTLKPGAVNDIVVGVVWVRPTGAYPCPTFKSILAADKKAQALFDNNFKLVDGPDAPNMTIRELSNELIISLWNGPTSNNYKEQYAEGDAVIKAELDDAIAAGVAGLDPNDYFYKFQGYKVYQLLNGQVSSSELDDNAKAKLIFQADRKDGVAKVINYEYDGEVDQVIPRVVVDGSNQGIVHTLKVTSDAFATGDPRLVNYKTYYFMAIAYAYNEWLPYEEDRVVFTGPDTSQDFLIVKGQSLPYKAGRKNSNVYPAIPHIISSENGGTKLNAQYGDGPEITRLDGKGNGGVSLDLTDQSIEDIVQFTFSNKPTYKGRSGPVDVMIYDPLKIPEDNFTIYIVDSCCAGSGNIIDSSAYWYMVQEIAGDTFWSDDVIGSGSEKLIEELGLVVSVGQVKNPGFIYDPPQDRYTADVSENNGLIPDASAIVFEEPDKIWLTGLGDADNTATTANPGFRNWIRAGEYSLAGPPAFNPSDYFYTNPDSSASYWDPDGVYESIIPSTLSGNGTWAPYRLVSKYTHGPGEDANPLGQTYTNSSKLKDLQSVDIVFTSDRSKWSRCVVVETGDDPGQAEGGAVKLSLRKHAGLNYDGTYSSDLNDDGMSFFPGYAVNLETGERLNIFYGESSWLVGENGNDMVWNPTGTINTVLGEVRMGGKHFIYVSNTMYDACSEIRDKLSTGNVNDRNNVYRNVMWVSIPLLANASKYTLSSFEEGIIPTKTTVKLRVKKPYEQFLVEGLNSGQPVYSFSTAGLTATKNDLSTATKTLLDSVFVVPNPYYAFSTYEASAIQNVVKITNLPSKCTVSIMTLDGALVRRFNRDDNTADKSLVTEETIGGAQRNPNALNWDLRNTANVPISSGVYIIHVDAPGVGEKTIKWLGIMRPVDLESF